MITKIIIPFQGIYIGGNSVHRALSCALIFFSFGEIVS
jgi:hypothetical protein